MSVDTENTEYPVLILYKLRTPIFLYDQTVGTGKGDTIIPERNHLLSRFHTENPAFSGLSVFQYQKAVNLVQVAYIIISRPDNIFSFPIYKTGFPIILMTVPYQVMGHTLSFLLSMTIFPSRSM